MHAVDRPPSRNIRLGTIVSKAFARFRRYAFGEGAAVLVYHQVGPADPFTSRLGICVATQEFERQIAILKQHFDVVPYSELITRRHDRTLLAITFDDGYRGVLTEALPILRAAKCPAKVFLNADQVDGNLGWLNKLNFLIEHLSLREIQDLATQALPGQKIETPRDPYPYWRFMVYPTTLRTIEDRFHSLTAKTPAEPCQGLFLSHQDLLTLTRDPLLEWGSHTDRHLPLDRVPPEEARRSIVDGHLRLKSILGDRLSGFAVPFGTAHLRTEPLAAQVAAVDRFFVTATNQRNWPVKVGILPELHRIPVGDRFDDVMAVLDRRWRFDVSGMIHGR